LGNSGKGSAVATDKADERDLGHKLRLVTLIDAVDATIYYLTLKRTNGKIPHFHSDGCVSGGLVFDKTSCQRLATGK
jgi:hypothetical protein